MSKQNICNALGISHCKSLQLYKNNTLLIILVIFQFFIRIFFCFKIICYITDMKFWDWLENPFQIFFMNLSFNNVQSTCTLYFGTNPLVSILTKMSLTVKKMKKRIICTYMQLWIGLIRVHNIGWLFKYWNAMTVRKCTVFVGLAI